MKQVILGVPVFALLIFATPVFAANTNSGSGAQGAGSQQVTTSQTQQQQRVPPSPTGNQVQNQNQVTTQNEGEASQLQTNTQEQENLSGSKEALSRSETVSNVAQKVEELLTAETMSGDIGQQVKAIAQEQKIAQEQLHVELGKIDSRGGLLKSIIGPDFKALKNIQKQMEQNQLRIQQLEQLKTQLSNQGDTSLIQATMESLVQQNVALQEQTIAEEKTKSLFGWLFRLI